MSQERLNGLTILSIEKELLKQIDHKTVVNEFASKKARKAPNVVESALEGVVYLWGVIVDSSGWHWAGSLGAMRVLDGTLGWLGQDPRVLAYWAVGLGLLKGIDIPPRDTLLDG
ncbi:hypothetical protein H5410_057199 [Solanum commersonii]|uniref:Uncharacterized protein n=1 Tax=Solanum commersonii TaxID=4109 RepID=A0A9J5WMC3_SOLCO|nr:hypothetical protein H5410_057199 [Solanum commersonii]